MGEGFNAWYLESLIESAKENEPKPARTASTAPSRICDRGDQRIC